MFEVVATRRRSDMPFLIIIRCGFQHGGFQFRICICNIHRLWISIFKHDQILGCFAVSVFAAAGYSASSVGCRWRLGVRAGRVRDEHPFHVADHRRLLPPPVLRGKVATLVPDGLHLTCPAPRILRLTACVVRYSTIRFNYGTYSTFHSS